MRGDEVGELGARWDGEKGVVGVVVGVIDWGEGRG